MVSKLIIKLIKIFLLITLFTILLCKNYEIEKFTNSSKKKLICFSLWGSNGCYNWGALENALLAKKIYPGWICRFYIGKNVIPEVINYLKELNNVELVFMKENKAMANTFWRFIPCFEEECEIYLSRDTDSRLNIREKKAVEIWENSNKNILIIRDHKEHKKRFLAGMFGVRNNILNKFKKDFRKRYNSSNMQYGDEEKFLETVIYPKIKNDCIIFDKMKYFSDEKVIQIPEKEYLSHIGSIECNNYDEIKKHYGLNIKEFKRVRDYSNDFK